MGTYSVHYLSSVSSLANFDMQAAPGLIVSDVLNLITERGRHRYQLAPNGLGCRFWV